LGYLILINLCLLELCLALLLEGDDDQGHEDVDKEERKDNEVNNVENGHLYPANGYNIRNNNYMKRKVIIDEIPINGDRSLVLISHSHGLLQHPAN
jgi:hypothetical protein